MACQVQDGGMDLNSANVEHEHVHKVYSQIASHFSDTRFKPWPKIAHFLREQPTASLIADVGKKILKVLATNEYSLLSGCGNGKYLGVNPLAFCVGSDICPELVSIAGDRGHQVAVCDCLQLPYRSEVFDALICIAVIHHLSTEERRLSALREMARILKSGGHMLVYVWAMEQDKRKVHVSVILGYNIYIACLAYKGSTCYYCLCIYSLRPRMLWYLGTCNPNTTKELAKRRVQSQLKETLKTSRR